MENCELGSILHVIDRQELSWAVAEGLLEYVAKLEDSSPAETDAYPRSEPP